MAKEKRRLTIGEHGEVRLPLDAMEALGLEPGEQVTIFVDTRRKQIRLERHVDDAWAEAMKKKKEKGLEDVLGEQKDREEEAKKLFEERLKNPPKPEQRRPEDDPDYWR